MSAPYISQPADAAALAAVYHDAVRPEAIVAAALRDPAVATKARQFGAADLLDAATFVLDKLEPVAVRGLGVIDKWQHFNNTQMRRAAVISFGVMEPLIAVATKVLGWAIRLTSPATSIVIGWALKAAVVALLPELAGGSVLSLSDPACKTGVRRASAAELAAARRVALETPLYRYTYVPGAATPAETAEHLGVMADDLLAAGIGDGHAVPVMDLVAACMVALRDLDGRVRVQQAQIDALRAAAAAHRARNDSYCIQKDLR